MQFPLVLALLLVAAEAPDPLVVSTASGQIRGSIIKSRKGRDIFSFRGIPYAKPPLGQLRFKAPEPLDPWGYIFNATDDGPACLQPYEEDTIGPTSEDCLYLNVYTTQLPGVEKNNTQRAVLVWFHSGGWYENSGTSRTHGPQYFMDEDFVLVTSNYRLGALGFLSSGDGILRGNYGMKDQVAVLRWVRENIGAFGGDYSRVTIGGYSVGGASVVTHLLSPMSRGLFHQAISMSASIDTKWNIDKDPIQVARKIAKAVDCPIDTSQNVADCLSTKPAKELALAIRVLNEWAFNPILIYFPVIEPDLNDGTERFLTQDPYEQLISGNFAQVPWMVGYTKDEFAWKALNVLRNSTLAEDMYTNFRTIAPINFMYERGTNRSYYISDQLNEFYLQNKPITNESYDGLGKLYSDAIICFGEDRAAKIISGISHAPVYFYTFTYQGRYSFENTVQGVFHHDELIYLFYISTMDFPFFKPDDPEVLTLERLTKMWANFINTGNPTPEVSELLSNTSWSPMTPNNLNYLDIGDNLLMKRGLNQDRMDVWTKLFPYTTTPKIKKK